MGGGGSKNVQHHSWTIPKHFFLNRGVSEESFLKTPFFNGRECSKPEISYKFKDVFSPGIAISEVVDLKQLPNLKLEDYYTQIKVSLVDCHSYFYHSDS
jgi:hypothetical protein